jgi:hypothetical protein
MGHLAVPLWQPLSGVPLDELDYHLPSLLQRLEAVEIQVLLLQCPDPPFHDTVALRFTDVAGAGPEFQPGEFAQKLSGGVLWVLVHQKTETGGNLRSISNMRPLCTLTNWLQGRPTITTLRRKPASNLLGTGMHHLRQSLVKPDSGQRMRVSNATLGVVNLQPQSSSFQLLITSHAFPCTT